MVPLTGVRTGWGNVSSNVEENGELMMGVWWLGQY